MAKYLQEHLEDLKVPMTVLAIDTIGHLPITSNGNSWKQVCGTSVAPVTYA